MDASKRRQLTVFFDLDGTLADTAQDIMASIIEAFAIEGITINTSDALIKAAGKGRVALIQAATEQHNIPPQQIAQMTNRFVEIYSKRMYDTTRLYPGVKETLETLDLWGVRWGIITNKRSDTGQPLLRWLGILDNAICTVFGDTTDESKPSPKPLLYASEQIRVPPQKCVMVGDTKRDIEAGRSADMTTIAVTQTHTHHIVAQWQPDFILPQTKDILQWLNHNEV